MAPEKRKYERRIIEPRKRFHQTPPARDTPPKEAAPKPVEEPLPTKINSGKPLPVLRDYHRQHERALQSMAESGVLAASLERSRNKWLADGIFEKYWTKPTKKKGQPAEPPNNPGKDTMSRLGVCRITIEPHIFDATLFTIRDASAPKPKPAPKQHIQQNTFAPGQQQQMPMYQNVPMSQASAFHQRDANVSAPSGKTEPLKPEASKVKAAPAPAHAPSKAAPTAAKAQPVPTPGATPAGAATSATTASPAPKTSPDPVIQLLAQRASTNPELKVLMKIVASGTASPEQLRVFQNQIDELTAIHHRQTAAREAQAKKAATAASAPKPIAAQSAFTPQNPASNSMFQAQHQSFPSYPPPVMSYAYNSQLPKALPPQPPKPDIIGIAIEFTAGSGDRFLLPKASIMQHIPSGRQALLSFLVVRKSKPIDGSTSKKKEEDFFQPVTIRVWAEQSKVFDAISRSLTPADEVRKQMEEIISSKKRADSVQLALQLPREFDIASESSRQHTPIPTSKAADRRQSLLKASVLPSTPGTETPTKKEKINQFAEHHCMYCFDPVEAPAEKFEGKTTCEPCRILRRKDIIRSGAPRGSFVATVRHSTAPQALTL